MCYATGESLHLPIAGKNCRFVALCVKLTIFSWNFRKAIRLKNWSAPYNIKITLPHSNSFFFFISSSFKYNYRCAASILCHLTDSTRFATLSQSKKKRKLLSYVQKNLLQHCCSLFQCLSFVVIQIVSFILSTSKFLVCVMLCSPISSRVSQNCDQALFSFCFFLLPRHLNGMRKNWAQKNFLVICPL